MDAPYDLFMSTRPVREGAATKIQTTGRLHYEISANDPKRKIVAPKANCQTIVFGSNLRNIRLRGGVPGGRDVESRSCRSDSNLHLHFVRNAPVGSLVAPGNRGVVHGRRLSGDWSSAHCRERSGCSSQGASPRVSARVLRVQLWNVPAVRDIPVWIRVSAPVRIRVSAGVAI